MRVAVTGVSGFIGSHIARRLSANGHRVIGVVRASSPREHVADAVERFVSGDHADAATRAETIAEADAVVHNSLDRGSSGESLDAALQRNLVASIHWLEASAPRPFVFVSSVAAVVAACLEQERANGGIYNLADCYARWADLAAMAAEELGIDDAEIDFSSPPAPRNQFDKTSVQALGVGLDRGHEGIRTHLRALIERMGVL